MKTLKKDTSTVHSPTLKDLSHKNISDLVIIATEHNIMNKSKKKENQLAINASEIQKLYDDSKELTKSLEFS
jgi:hypothetical protein